MENYLQMLNSIRRMRNKAEFSLIPINSSKKHIGLYNLLKERAHNISHKQLQAMNINLLF